MDTMLIRSLSLVVALATPGVALAADSTAKPVAAQTTSGKQGTPPARAPGEKPEQGREKQARQQTAGAAKPQAPKPQAAKPQAPKPQATKPQAPKPQAAKPQAGPGAK